MEQLQKISVCIITYNQEAYIKQTLESVLKQEISLDLEVVVSNDCSTDGTHKVIQTVLEEHAKGHLVKYYNQECNLGMMLNFKFALEQCSGSFIAICEGDDYWTDPLKLEKQVAFLQNNSNYGMCFHNTEQINFLNNDEIKSIPGVLVDTDYTIQDYILANKTATCSMVYRKEFFHDIPDWFVRVPFGDLALVLTVLKNSENKKARVLKDTMAVYRIHATGVHGSLHKTNKSLILAYKQHLHFMKIIKIELLQESVYKLALTEKKMKTYAKLAGLTKKENKLLQYLKYKMLWYVKLLSININL